MTSLNDIGDLLAREAYSFGEDPLFYAEVQVTVALEVRDQVTEARRVHRAAFPHYPADLRHVVLARRILGQLLDLGWTPPAIDKTTPEARTA